MSPLQMFMHKLTKSFYFLWPHFVLILLTTPLAPLQNFYIVFLGAHPLNRDIAVDTHLNVLSSVKGSYVEANESIVYSYTKSFNAFAAKLSDEEANKLSAMDEVLSVIQSQYRKLDTTRTWNFIGLPLTAKRRLKLESDIGSLESQSFKDHGFDRPPARWKGSCGHYANFSGCNKFSFFLNPMSLLLIFLVIDSSTMLEKERKKE
ncbi:hypothetical protein Lal_00042906 [Lupinus albus]|nr:hypothetical protein Lal_00042906 [Lupinus albus]